LGLNRHLAELDLGRGVDMPRYDFKAGTRSADRLRFEPGADSLILLDTLHGLYEPLTASVPDTRKFRLYIETIGQLRGADDRWTRWTDVRLLRRMIRDSKHRGYSPEQTVLHWHYVRRAELKHIIPYQASADFLVNSSLAYEIPILKRHLAAFFPPFLEKWRGDERRLDAVIRAERVLALLNSIEGDVDESAVPASSLLREFIGGSSYDVHS
jgi:uridine kinase